MTYAEHSFFDGAAFQHIADREEKQRLDRKRDELRRLASRSYPGGSFGPRIRSQMAESIDAFMALGRREEK